MRSALLLVALGLFLHPFVTIAAGQSAPQVSATLNYKSLPPGQQAVIAVVIDIPTRFHIQSDKPIDPQYIATEVTIKPNGAVETYAPIFPDPLIRNYPALGRLSVLEGQPIVYVPIQVKQDAKPGPLVLQGSVHYQMCDDKACFPPADVEFSVNSQIVAPGTALEANQPDLFKNFDPSAFSKLLAPAKPAARQATIFGRNLGSDSYLLAFCAAFVVGIIFNVVPCVLPVVPLKIMGFYEVSQHNRRRSFAFGLVFSLGVVAVFAALGLVVVVWRKAQWGELYSNPWFLIGIIVLLLGFGLSQFGAFSVGVPQFFYRITPRHDTYIGNFLFGILTAILSTPCTFGMFFVLLIWAASQPWQIGLTLMIIVGMGMAFPYLVLSAIPEVARRFPRAGPWAELVKQMMGFLLIGSAVFFARRFIQGFFGDKIFWWVLFAVVLTAGIYLIARSIQFSRTLLPRLVAAAVALLLVAPSLAFTIRQTNPPIDWKPFAPDTVAAARAGGKNVIVEFTAAWCANCLTLEATTFHDPRTVAAIKEHQVIAFRADLTDEHAPGWKTLREISPIGAIPLTAVYPAGSKEPIPLSGIYSPSDLINALKATSVAVSLDNSKSP